MPAVSERQRNFMAMCMTAKGRRKAMKACPSAKVAREFARGPARPKRGKAKKGGGRY
jgi:hypothetical protein